MANWQYVHVYPDRIQGPFVDNPSYEQCAGIHGNKCSVSPHETFLQDLDEIPEVKSLLKIRTTPIEPELPPTVIEIDGEDLFKYDPKIRTWLFKLRPNHIEWLVAGRSVSKLLDEVVKIA